MPSPIEQDLLKKFYEDVAPTGLFGAPEVPLGASPTEPAPAPPEPASLPQDNGFAISPQEASPSLFPAGDTPPAPMFESGANASMAAPLAPSPPAEAFVPPELPGITPEPVAAPVPGQIIYPAETAPAKLPAVRAKPIASGGPTGPTPAAPGQATQFPGANPGATPMTNGQSLVAAVKRNPNDLGSIQASMEDTKAIQQQTSLAVQTGVANQAIAAREEGEIEQQALAHAETLVQEQEIRESKATAAALVEKGMAEQRTAEAREPDSKRWWNDQGTATRAMYMVTAALQLLTKPEELPAVMKMVDKYVDQDIKFQQDRIAAQIAGARARMADIREINEIERQGRLEIFKARDTRLKSLQDMIGAKLKGIDARSDVAIKNAAATSAIQVKREENLQVIAKETAAAELKRIEQARAAQAAKVKAQNAAVKDLQEAREKAAEVGLDASKLTDVNDIRLKTASVKGGIYQAEKGASIAKAQAEASPGMNLPPGMTALVKGPDGKPVSTTFIKLTPDMQVKVKEGIIKSESARQIVVALRKRGDELGWNYADMLTDPIYQSNLRAGASTFARGQGEVGTQTEQDAERAIMAFDPINFKTAGGLAGAARSMFGDGMGEQARIATDMAIEKLNTNANALLLIGSPPGEAPTIIFPKYEKPAELTKSEDVGVRSGKDQRDKLLELINKAPSTRGNDPLAAKSKIKFEDDRYQLAKIKSGDVKLDPEAQALFAEYSDAAQTALSLATDMRKKYGEGRAFEATTEADAFADADRLIKAARAWDTPAQQAAGNALTPEMRKAVDELELKVAKLRPGAVGDVLRLSKPPVSGAK